MYTIDDLRAVVLHEVIIWHKQADLRPADYSADSAWQTVKHLARTFPDSCMNSYYYESGKKEEQRFKDAWNAWLDQVNG